MAHSKPSEHAPKPAEPKQHGGHGHGHGLPLWKNVTAGALAGLVEVLIMYPLDLVKTRFQLSTGSTNQSMIGAFRDLVKTEGFFNLYRGIISPIFAEAPKRALKFSSNEEYKKLFANSNPPGVGIQQWQVVCAGAGAGMTEAVVNCPFELVKVRMQAKENLGVYKSTLEATQQIIAKEGPLALYKGFEAQLWRNGAWNATYFGVINYVKDLLKPKPGDQPIPGTNFFAGFIAGTLATTINNPFDVVKSRVQNVLPGQVRRYGWAIPGIFKVAREEGVKALYRGYVPKVLRLGPGGGIMIVGFDFFADLLR